MQFVAVPTLLLEPSDNAQKLKGNSLLLLTAIMKYFPHMYPSIRRLSEITGLHRQTIHKHLNILERFKVIKRFRRQGVPNLYQINPALLVGKAGMKGLAAWNKLKDRWVNRAKRKLRTTPPTHTYTNSSDTIQKEIINPYINSKTDLNFLLKTCFKQMSC